MARIAAFDLGTTALKCVVLDEKQNISFSGKENISTIHSDGFIEQDPHEWWEAFLSLAKRFDTSDIDYIIFSGQMQDLYFLDSSGEPIGNAVLYDDQRGAEFVDELPSYISDLTSISMNGTIPISKILWFKKNRPDVLEKAEHLLISAKDYLVYKLTGRCVSDVTNMSTSGMMDILKKEYIPLSGLVESRLLPTLMYSDEVAGLVSDKASEATGFRRDVEVFVGSGDAGATTLAAGVTRAGEFSVNLGTSGWVASLSDRPMDGVFNLAAINRGLYINVIPVLNAANVHNWISRVMYPEGERNRYDVLHDILSSDKHGNDNLLCMPYLVGERFPVADDKVRGVYVGLDNSTTLSDLARSALEGVAFSLRMGMDNHRIKPSSVSLIGGGASESVWNQIFADIFNAPVVVFEDSEALPSIALSSVVLYGKKLISSYSAFISSILAGMRSETYYPNEERVRHYEKLYERFKLIYPSVRNIFRS